MILQTLPMLLLALILTLTGCNAAQLGQSQNNAAPEPVAAIAVEEPAEAAEEEAIQMMSIEDETPDAAAAAIGASSEQQAIRRAELERIRREGQQAQGPVRNAPDYN